MVEVGVQSGGSAMMWKSYFGPGLRYYGIDINPQAQQFQSDWATIFIGDQADPAFWDSLRGKLPKEVDFFLDDGGHTMEQQKVTFQKAFPLVKLNGVYACEDLSTSYSPDFGSETLKPGSGGPKGSFIELAKVSGARGATKRGQNKRSDKGSLTTIFINSCSIVGGSCEN